jgi:tRNA(fMet)-specific endonuclease VapC
MRYMLDTNICIYLIKRRPPAVIDRFLRCDVGQVAISSVTLAELQYGVAKSQFPKKNAEALQAFLLPLEILPFDDAAGAAYGPIRVDLEKRGVSIGAMDLLIAAHALSLDITLVTHNTREFSRVHGLRVESWA